MTRRRLITLLVAALVALGAALLLSTKRNASQESAGGKLLPSLAAELSGVNRVSVRKGATVPAVTLQKTPAGWTVAERADYPADVSKLRRLLTSLGDAKIVEEKTADPARYAAIGVDDATQAGTSGVEVDVEAPGGKQAVIVGKSSGEGVFARRAGENRSYLVTPAIVVESEPRSWIDTAFMDIASASIQSMTVTLAGAAPYTLRRIDAKPDSKGADPKVSAANAAGSTGTAANADSKDVAPNGGGFELDGVPAGRKALDSQALAPPGTMLGGLTAEDVAPESSIDFGKASKAVIAVAGGGVTTLAGASVGDKHWLQVVSTQDPGLQARAQGRAFEIAGYRYDGIFRPVDQLLQPKELPPAKSAVPPKTAVKLPVRRPPAPPPAPPAP